MIGKPKGNQYQSLIQLFFSISSFAQPKKIFYPFGNWFWIVILFETRIEVLILRFTEKRTIEDRASKTQENVYLKFVSLSLIICMNVNLTLKTAILLKNSLKTNFGKKNPSYFSFKRVKGRHWTSEWIVCPII